MKKYSLLTFFLFIISVFFVQGQTAEFSNKEKSIIYTNSLKVLQDYETTINQIGKDVIVDIEKARSSAEALIELFINRQVMVYNDLDPSHQLSPFYEIETYVSNMILWYPDGIDVALDFENAKVGNIKEHENNVYSLDIMLSRQINGNYLNKSINRSKEDLTFRIAFAEKGGGVNDFKIVGVRNARSTDMIDYSKALKDVNSEDLNEEELVKVYDGIKSILGDYNNYLALLGDPEELEEDKVFYRESFFELFQDKQVKVYNDIDPNPDKSLIEISTYLTNYERNFPDGIKNIALNIDSADFGQVIKDEDGSYYSYAYVDKFFSGVFEGKEPYSKMFPLSVRVMFEKSGKAYTDYSIAAIDFSGEDFFAQTSGTQDVELPDMEIEPVTRKGLFLKAGGSYGFTYINDQNLEGMTLASDNYEWTMTNDYGYSGGIGIEYFFNDHIGIGLGAYYNSYSASFSLNGTFQDDDYSTDVNGDSFYKIIDAHIDSAVSINYVSVPLYLSYISSKPGKIGFYVDAGITISYKLSSTYAITGSYQYYGYYPSNPEVMRFLYLEELGFYNRQNIDEAGDTEVASLNYSFYGSLGINIPFGYYSSLQIGPEVMLGLADVMGDREVYYDIFGNESDNIPAKTTRYGIKIGFVYKF